MTAIPVNLQAVRLAIARASQQAGRAPASVTLLAVSKTFPPEAIRAAYAAGQCLFGENYLQEALEKISALQALPLEWHFIGPIQSNKTRALAEHFSWIHSVERLKIAERLAAQRPPDMPPLNICLQVNVSGEASKSGAAPDEVETLALQIARLPRLRLRGLMAIPAPADTLAAQREPFARLRLLFDRLNTHGLQLDTLSMGMSQDMQAAIQEGATMVRIGSAIFGQRGVGWAKA
jgi:pyridoxal phosphate enzyme (YggS family)